MRSGGLPALLARSRVCTHATRQSTARRRGGRGGRAGPAETLSHRRRLPSRPLGGALRLPAGGARGRGGRAVRAGSGGRSLCAGARSLTAPAGPTCPRRRPGAGAALPRRGAAGRQKGISVCIDTQRTAPRCLQTQALPGRVPLAWAELARLRPGEAKFSPAAASAASGEGTSRPLGRGTRLRASGTVFGKPRTRFPALTCPATAPWLRSCETKALLANKEGTALPSRYRAGRAPRPPRRNLCTAAARSGAAPGNRCPAGGAGRRRKASRSTCFQRFLTVLQNRFQQSGVKHSGGENMNRKHSWE